MERRQLQHDRKCEICGTIFRHVFVPGKCFGDIGNAADFRYPDCKKKRRVPADRHVMGRESAERLSSR